MSRPGLNLQEKTDPVKVLAYKAKLFTQIRLKKADGSIIPYLPHKGQDPIHFPHPDDPWYRYVCPWGTRSGKTLGAAAEIIVGLGMEDNRAWIAAPHYDLTDRVFDLVWEQVINNNIHGPDSVTSKGWSQNRRYIRMKWGAFLIGKSADSPTSLLGEQLDLLVCDEFARFPEGLWASHLEGRLLDRKGKALFISTPRGFNQFHEFFQRGFEEEFRAAGWRSLRFTTPENPFIDAKYLAAQRDLMGDLNWRQEYLAEFVAYAGLIYPDFRASNYPDGHLFDPRDINVESTWTHRRAIDIGTSHPTACLWAATNPDNRVHVYREYCLRDASHEEHAANITSMTTHPISRTVISPDAERKSRDDTGRDTTVRGIYRSKGIHAHLAVDDWNAGVSVVTAFLRGALQPDSTHPGVLISTACPLTIKAIQGYEHAGFSERSDKLPPDVKPRHRNDDLPDAFRYGLATDPSYRSIVAEDSQTAEIIRRARYGYGKPRKYRPPGPVNFGGGFGSYE